MVVIGVAGGHAGAFEANHRSDRDHVSRSPRHLADPEEARSTPSSPTSRERGFFMDRELTERSVHTPSEGSTKNQRLCQASMHEWNKVLRNAGFQPDDFEEVEELWTNSLAWNGLLAFMIGLNAIVLGFETDHNRDSAKSHIVWNVFEYSFLIFWLIDIGCRMVTERWQYVYNPWSYLDMFLVALNCFEVIVMPLAFGAGTEKVGFLRVLRVLRLLRLLRLVQSVPFCNKLWRIIIGFLDALRTLGWVLLLLFLVVYAGSIIMTNVVGHQCDEDYSAWSECHDIFGTVFGSMYSLFQVITMEGWCMLIARPVTRKMPAIFFFFLIFLFLTTFGLLNIIVGVIVDNTLKSSNDEQAKAEKARMRKMFDEMLEMRDVFAEADEDGNGNVDMDEFAAILRKTAVRETLVRFDIPFDRPEHLFEMLDEDEGGSLNINEFIDGITRIRSAPKPSDMRTACIQATNICAHLDILEENVRLFRESCSAGGIKLGKVNLAALQTKMVRETSDRSGNFDAMNTDIPVWGSEDRKDSSLHSRELGEYAQTPTTPAIPIDPSEIGHSVFTPPRSPGGSPAAPSGMELLALPGVHPRNLRPLEVGVDKEAQILSSELLAWEPEGVLSGEGSVVRLVQASQLATAMHPSWTTRTTAREAKDTNELRERLDLVEQTVDTRLGHLETVARQLARSQRQLQTELDEVLRRRHSS